MLAALAATNVLVVAGIGWAYGTDGALSTVAALVLAPAAVLATAAVGRRLGGDRFALGAAATYVVLPLLANRFMLGSYRGAFDRQALPDLVGLRATWWFALGVAVCLVVAFVRPRIAAAAGLVATTAALVVWGAGDLSGVRGGLHETAWSITLLEWFFVAGVIGAARRGSWLAVGVGGWLAALILHAAHVGYDGAAFWQSLAAGVPAAALLLSSLALLVPLPRRRPTPMHRHAP